LNFRRSREHDASASLIKRFNNDAFLLLQVRLMPAPTANRRAFSRRFTVSKQRASDLRVISGRQPCKLAEFSAEGEREGFFRNEDTTLSSHTPHRSHVGSGVCTRTYVPRARSLSVPLMFLCALAFRRREKKRAITVQRAASLAFIAAFLRSFLIIDTCRALDYQRVSCRRRFRA